MLPSGGRVLRYVKTLVGSQTDWYLGVLGLLLNTAFKKRLTNGWEPTVLLSSKCITDDRAQRAVFRLL